MLKKISALLIVASLFFSSMSSADVFSTASILVQHTGEKSLRVIGQLPLKAIKEKAYQLDAACDETQRHTSRMGDIAQVTSEIDCQIPVSDVERIVVPWAVAEARLEISTMDGRTFRSLNGSGDSLSIPLTTGSPIVMSYRDVVINFLYQGVLHIWFGWDHLIFVLCICLIASRKQIIWLISAFTIGHTLTLSLSYLDIVYLPIAPVEALIAFSIVLLAREALLKGRDSHSSHSRTSLFVIAIFGLVHGLGFASALGALGVPQDKIISSLLFFNLGVEIGQIISVAFLLALFSMLKRLSVDGYLRFVGACFSGLIGSFWLFERMYGFSG